jgi:hypothetical protein
MKTAQLLSLKEVHSICGRVQLYCAEAQFNAQLELFPQPKAKVHSKGTVSLAMLLRHVACDTLQPLLLVFEQLTDTEQLSKSAIGAAMGATGPVTGAVMGAMGSSTGGGRIGPATGGATGGSIGSSGIGPVLLSAGSNAEQVVEIPVGVHAN